MDRNVGDDVGVKYFGENAAPGAVHGVDGKLEIRAADEIEVRELGNGFDVGGLQIHLFDGRGCPTHSRFVRRSGRAAARDGAIAKFVFDGLHDRGRGRASKLRFELHAIPIPRIVARSDHDTARCAQLLDVVGNRGRRHVVVRQQHGKPRASDYFSDGTSGVVRQETRVIDHYNAARVVFDLVD